LDLALSNLASFIGCIKEMALQTQAIPDLAGVGNLILTPGAQIKLVDINNISRFSHETAIPLDDKKYPVSDKSIQALYNLDTQVLGNDQAGSEELYRFFMDPQRIQAVREIEIAFQQRIDLQNYTTGLSTRHGPCYITSLSYMLALFSGFATGYGTLLIHSIIKDSYYAEI
jgi:hypothetical protein